MTDTADLPGAEIVHLAEPAREASALAPTMEMLGLPSPAEFAALRGMAEQLAMSNLVPKPLVGKPADIFLILLTGRDLRIGATMALQRVYVIEGKPSISAELMVALVLRAGYRIWPDPENDATKATAHAIRDGQALSATFTMEDATAANLTGKGPWRTFPKSMLWARAVSTLCRQSFPDVLTGVTYTPEELDVPVDESGQVIGDPYRPSAAMTPNDEARSLGWLGLADYESHKVEIVDGVAKLSEYDRAAYKAWMVDNGYPPKGWSRATWEHLSAELAQRLNPGATVATDPIGSGPQGAPVVTDYAVADIHDSNGHGEDEPDPWPDPPGGLPQPGDWAARPSEARPRQYPTAEEVATDAEAVQRRSDEQAVTFAEKMGHEVPEEIRARHAERIERAKASLAAAEAVHRGETPVDTPEPPSEPQTATQEPLGDDEALRPNGASDVIRASEFLVARGDKALGETPYDELVALSRAMDLSTKGTAVALRTRIARHICEGLDEVEAMKAPDYAPDEEPFA